MLSVSSNGSNGLRRLRSLASCVGGRTFSILERIEWAATGLTIFALAALSPFSILERIEWAATTTPRRR